MKTIRQLALTTVVFVAAFLLGKPKKFRRVSSNINIKIIDHESRLALNRCLYESGVLKKGDKQQADQASYKRTEKEILKYLNI